MISAGGLAAALAAFETPEAVYRHRLALAAQVADELRSKAPVVAALVVGSTALRRCSARADLDVVVITRASEDGGRFESRTLDGVAVEIEWLSRHDALACTAGAGWVWELRQAARLGCSVPVIDTHGFAAVLARRSAAMTLEPDRVAATLRGVYLSLVDLGRAGRGSEALRGCLDNLALLALLERPRRYQKAKWALADLLHEDEHELVDALLAAYGVDSEVDAHDAVAGAHELIAHTYRLAGVPAHEAVLAMGHAPEHAEASYVSRCLADAQDLAATGRAVEAQYVAKFAARLAAGMASSGQGGGDVVDAFAALGGDDLVSRYLALFDGAPDPTPELLEAVLAAADRCRDGAPTAAALA